MVILYVYFNNKVMHGLYCFWLGRFGRDNSSGPDLKSHFSVSLDYGSDVQLTGEQISFNSFKDNMDQIAGDNIEVRGTEVPESAHPMKSYQEAIGMASSTVSVICQ